MTAGNGIPESRLEQLVESCLLRMENGEAGALEASCREHPELADDLRAHMRVVESVYRELHRAGSPSLGIGGANASVDPAARSAADGRGSASEGATPGGRLGRFELREEIGRGGMGVVYGAFDRRVGREVALKVMSSSAARQPWQRARFGREIRAVARLKHSGILPVYEVGEDGDSLFYVMERVDGRSVRDLLEDATSSGPRGSGSSAIPWFDVFATAGSWSRNGQSSSDVTTRRPVASESGSAAGRGRGPARGHSHAAARIALRVAEALAHAHAEGVVHRDVKPGNILIGRDGRVLLVDFGLALVDEEATLTVSGDFLGTPYYAPPERVRGDGSTDDPRGDVYSLGITLYEMLTFHRPFAGKSREQIFRQILTHDPAAPRALNSEIPADLETIVLRSIEKDPRHRYASAAELADDLERFLEARPILARRAGPVEKLHKWARREPALAALAAGLLVAVLLILVGIAWYGTRIRTYADTVAERERIAARNLYQADMSLAAQACHNLDWYRVERLLEAHRPDPGEEDLRGFEWFYLWNRGHTGVTFQRPPVQTMSAAALEPGGEILALGDANGRILLWSLADETVLAEARPHHSVLRVLAYSPDGRFLASGDEDRRVIVHDADLGSIVAEFGPFVEEVASIDFSPSSRRMAVAAGYYTSPEGEVRVWNTDTWEEAYPALSLSMARQARFSGEDRLVVASYDRVWVRDLERDVIECEIDPKRAPIRSEGGVSGLPIVTISGSESARGKGELVVWNEDGTVRARRATAALHLAAMSPDGTLLAVGSKRTGADDQRDGRGGIDIFAFPSLEQRAFLEGKTFGRGHLIFSPDGRTLVSAEGGRVGLWDLDALARPREHRLPHARSLSLSRDGKRLAASSNSGVVRVWNAETGAEYLDDRMPDRVNTHVEIVPDGSRVHAASYGSVACWEVESGAPLWSEAIEGQRCGFAASPDGDYIAYSWRSADESRYGIAILDAETGLREKDLVSRELRPAALSFSPDGEELAFGNHYEGSIYAWSWRTDDDPVRIKRASGPATSLAYSPDGRTLAASGDVTTVWDLERGKVVARLHTSSRATDCAFLDAGRRFVVCSAGGLVTFVDTATWKEFTSFRAHSGYLGALAVARDAPVMATGAFDARVRIWWGQRH